MLLALLGVCVTPLEQMKIIPGMSASDKHLWAGAGSLVWAWRDSPNRASLRVHWVCVEDRDSLRLAGALPDEEPECCWAEAGPLLRVADALENPAPMNPLPGAVHARQRF